MSWLGNSVQPTLTKGKLRRGELRWMVEAIRSLPTPVSPQSSTLASERVQISINRRTRRMAGEVADHRLIDVADGGFQGLGRRVAAPPAGGLDPGQQREDVFVAKGLGEEIEGPQLPRFHRQRDAAVGGHDDHFRALGRRPA